MHTVLALDDKQVDGWVDSFARFFRLCLLSPAWIRETGQSGGADPIV